MVSLELIRTLMYLAGSVRIKGYEDLAETIKLRAVVVELGSWCCGVRVLWSCGVGVVGVELECLGCPDMVLVVSI